jgi:hypothetical protein
MTTGDSNIRDMAAAAWYRWVHADRPLSGSDDTTNTVPRQYGDALQAAFLAGARFAREHR